MAADLSVMDSDQRSRIMIGHFIRKYIFTEDYQTGRLSARKFNKMLRQHLRFKVAPDTGVSPYKLEKLAMEILATYKTTQHYLDYVELVREARMNHMTPEQFFNARRIEQIERDRASIDEMRGYGDQEIGG